MSFVIRSYQSGPTTFVKETEPYDSQYPESKAPESDQSHYSASNFAHVSGFNTSFQHEVHPQGIILLTEWKLQILI